MGVHQIILFQLETKKRINDKRGRRIWKWYSLYQLERMHLKKALVTKAPKVNADVLQPRGAL